MAKSKSTGVLSSRREVLSALTGAALPAPVYGQGGTRRKVGIVGGGIAGIALAWLLDEACDVVLLEARRTLGGNVQTVSLELDGQVYAIDMGAQYFHPKLYPSYIRLLTRLGLYPPAIGQSHSFPASISLFADGKPTPHFVSPILPDKWWPIITPWNWDGLGAFAVGFGAAKALEDRRADWNLTLEAWLKTLGLSNSQWEGMLLPWAASLFTGRTEQAREFSARAAMIFAATSVPDSPFDPVVSYVLNRGMAEPLRRMVDQMKSAQILTGAQVERIARDPQGGFLITCADRRRERVDELVLASSGPASLRLLEGITGTNSQQAALRGIEFEDTRIAVHKDPAYAPSDPNHRSFLNCQIHNEYCEASMSLAKVLAAPPTLPGGIGLWKSWVTHRERQPNNLLHESSFRHMVPTVATLRAQTRLLELQGNDRIWFAGGYTAPFDCQETALVSAWRIAHTLSPSSSRVRMLAMDCSPLFDGSN